MNRINQACTRDLSLEELILVSGGNGASDDVDEEQIETVVVSGSYGGVSSGTVSALGSSVTGNWGGGYGSFLQGYLPGAIGTAARAGANESGEDLERIGNLTMASGALIGLSNPKVGSRVSGVGGAMWISGNLLQMIEP